MSKVSAICPKCKRVIGVDLADDAAVCEFCSAPFIVEKAIEAFNLATVGNNGSSGSSSDDSDNGGARRLFDNIKVQLSKGQYDAAYKTKCKLIEEYPSSRLADEAEILCDLKNKEAKVLRDLEMIEEIIESHKLYGFTINIDSLIVHMLDLCNSNSDVGKQYMERLENETNAYLKRNCNLNFSGGLVFYKLYATYINNYMDEFAKGISVVLPEAKKTAKQDTELYGMEYNPQYYVIGAVVGNGGCRRDRRIIDNYKILKRFEAFLVNGETDEEPSCCVRGCCVREFALNGYDDAFCNYIMKFADEYKRKVYSDIRSINAVLQRDKEEHFSLDEHMFDSIKDAALKLMSPQGLAEYNENERRQREEAAKVKALKDRQKREKQIQQVTTIWMEYSALIKQGKIKAAYDLLMNSKCKLLIIREMLFFKKGLWGYKYVGKADKESLSDILEELII